MREAAPTGVDQQGALQRRIALHQPQVPISLILADEETRCGKRMERKRLSQNDTSRFLDAVILL